MRRKSVWMLIVVMMLLFAMTSTAFSADSTVTWRGEEAGFGFAPGSTYTATDLFENFKNVMPGDSLTETVTVKNAATDSDYIKVYLRAELHEQTDNPLTAQTTETVVSMQDFLAQLTMRVYCADTLIFEGAPHITDGLTENVLLGTLARGESKQLRVELDVPKSLGNTYANRLGEVDWVFLVECIENEKLTVHKTWEDNGYPDRPQEVTVALLRDGAEYDTVVLNDDNEWSYVWNALDDRYEWTVEERVPEGYAVRYKKTGNTVFIVNKMDYEPTVPAAPKTITAVKKWDDENNKNGKRPDSVTMTLYRGTQEVDKVTLNAQNDWTYTWTELDGTADWSVLETNIPKSYVPSYREKDGVVTVTNTEKLIQTGAQILPIAIVGGLGLLLVICGVLLVAKKRRNDRA